MDRKTKQKLIALALALVVALVSWVGNKVEERRHPHQPEHPPADTAPPPHPPGQEPPVTPTGPEPITPAVSPHLLLGNPSGAVTDLKHANNYLVVKPYYALSYNAAKGGANWVSWRLQRSDLGDAARSEFHPDTSLPSQFPRVTPNDYTNSGFDRGHLCPRSDRTATKEMANSTFLMSNIVPQSPHMNQRAWNDLEEYTRGLLKPGVVLYIVAGVSGVGGEGTNGRADTIGKGGKVTVAAKCWKVIVVVETGTGGDDDLGRVTATGRVIAVVMPNDQSVGHGWTKYRVRVADIEALTGYAFFDRVSPAVAGPLKAKVDDAHVPPPGKSKAGE